MTTQTANTTEGHQHENAQSGKPDPRAGWPANIREKFDKADAALAQRAQDRGWTDAAHARMRDALTREHAALARAAQERHRREAEARKIAQADAGAKRKKDTHEKIRLGGIALRAGVAIMKTAKGYDEDLWLGALLDLREQFDAAAALDQDATIARWRERGIAANKKPTKETAYDVA